GGDAVEPVGQQGALGLAERAGAGERGAQRDRRGDRPGRVRGGRRRVGGDGGDDRLAGRHGQGRVALVLGQRYESERQPPARRVDEQGGPLLRHGQPPRLGDAVDHPREYLRRLAGGGRLGAGPRLAEDEAVERGVRQAEADVQVPAAPQVGHRVVGGGVGFLVTQVALQAVGGHGVQQALLVAEDAVDRRGLHAGRRADGAGGDRFAAALGQQLGGGFDDPVPVGLRHTATVTVPV